MLKLNS